MALHEREFFHEKPETKPARFTCAKCRHSGEYQVRWILRTRKNRIPQGADEHDRVAFGKLRNYLIRVDDALLCKRCQRKFDIPSQESIVFV
jgi:hypothetical protein